jgi:hypothetical protein
VSRKLQEKQARRRAEEQRRKEQQRAARRRNLVTVGIALMVAVVVVGLIAVEQSRDSQASGVARGEAGCNDVQTFKPEGRTHVPEGTAVPYQTSPPTSGNHWEVPAEARFYPPESVGDPPAERVVHNLEHGQVVIWYSPTAPGDEVEAVEDYIDSQRGQQTLGLLAVPYEDIPAESNVVMTAWGAIQSCERFSSAVADSFRADFQGKGPEQVGVPPFTPGDS